LRFLNHRRELLNACAEALRHAGVRSFEGRNAGVERALGAALARIGRRAGFLWGVMISDSPAFLRDLGLFGLSSNVDSLGPARIEQLSLAVMARVGGRSNEALTLVR
jgi:hypothetical protein